MNKLNHQLLSSLEVHIYKFTYSNGLITEFLWKSSIILGIVKTDDRVPNFKKYSPDKWNNKMTIKKPYKTKYLIKFHPMPK